MRFPIGVDKPGVSENDNVHHDRKINIGSDLQLWKAFKSGKEDAFILIYRTYFQKLYSYGHQFTRDSLLVEDCIQELFIELREKRTRLGDTTSIKFYLFKALRNRLFRMLSKKKTLPAHEELLDGYNFEIHLSDEHKMINAQLDEEVRQALNAALNKLTVRQREMILFFFYEKMSYAEIAEIMNLTKPKFARDLLYRSIAKLQDEMKGRNLELFTVLLCLGPILPL